MKEILSGNNDSARAACESGCTVADKDLQISPLSVLMRREP